MVEEMVELEGSTTQSPVQTVRIWMLPQAGDGELGVIWGRWVVFE